MAKRKSISQKVRFEVFKRDKFACQYCGGKAPDAVLVIDHIRPVVKGGDNELLNLVTSCHSCNSGKGARELSDNSVVEKQRTQIEELQERRDQLDMMLAWKKDLLDLDDHAMKELSDVWTKLTRGWYLSEVGEQQLRKLIREHGVASVMDAMKIAADHYIKIDPTTKKATPYSANDAWMFLGGILRTMKEQESRPYLHDLYKIRKAVRDDKGGRYDGRSATAVLDEAFRNGAAARELWRIVRDTSSFRDWYSDTVEYVEKLTAKGGGAQS